MRISARTATVQTMPGKVGNVFRPTGEIHGNPSSNSMAIGTRTQTLATMRRLLFGQPGVPTEEVRTIMKSLQDLPTDSLKLDSEITQIGELILALEEKWKEGFKH